MLAQPRFDAGILVQEMSRCGHADFAKLLAEALERGFCSMDPNVSHWVRRQAGLMDHELTTPMCLKDMVHLLLPEAQELLERHLSAGSDSHMHLLLCQKVACACQRGP